MKKARFFFYSFLVTIAIVVSLIFAATKSPSVQRMLADKVAKELSKEWGTHISIGRAVLNGLITVRLDSITIEDQSRLPMIQASQIGAKMSLTELLRGKFRIYARLPPS